ncbi:MAG: hypothetical protein IPK87_12635 [Planctomycetes bacterium]|nr:hypothetical protein [Planctomycetota bacterium]
MSYFDYLLIPHQYMQRVGELHWTGECDAITSQHETLALSASLAQFLEGAAGREKPTHFAFALHFLWLLLRQDDALQAAWREAGGNFRNAGALFADLTRALPRAPGDVPVRALASVLRHPAELAELHWLSRAAQTPPLLPTQFEAHLRQMLEAMTPEDIRHWLRHGRGKVTLRAPLPEPPPPPRRTLAGALEEALRRKRLAGVAPFVDRMVSALTLPPRRAARSELPVGGYASVTNRGHPDQILFSEFAGDELEFLRRYAENELLYWQREEPQSQVREDLFVVLDQGVRTWGETRLLLVAAAIAFGKGASRRGVPVQFAATSSEGRPVDPEQDALGPLLEASDLSPNPGAALETALSEPTYEARDVILLTHRLSLLEDDVRVAARRAQPGVRLFALGVDEQGHAELCELRRGAPVTLRQFRVTIDEPVAPVPADAEAAWQGPFEAIPMPFRFGIAGTLMAMALDTQGSTLVTASTNGLLQLWPTDGSMPMHLPRPLHKDEALGNPVAMCGVRGGVAVVYAASEFVVAHIDVAARRVKLAALGHRGNPELVSLSYVPQQHCIAVSGFGDVDPWMVVYDLDTGASSIVAAQGRVFEAQTRARQAEELLLPPSINVAVDRSLSGDALAHAPTPPGKGCQFAILNPGRGELAFRGTASVAGPARPMADGKPLLAGATLLEGVAAGGTLAVRRARDGHQSVLVFAGSQLKLRAELPTQENAPGLSISDDGNVLAWRGGSAQVSVLKLDAGVKPVAKAMPARIHSELAIDAGDYWFTVYGGKFTHLVRWDRDRLEICFLQGKQDVNAFIQRRHDCAALNPRRVHARWGVAGACSYDSKRFRQYAMSPGGLTLQTDIYGQLAVLGRDNSLVAMFFIYRGTVAAWLPDGTRYGPSAVTGGPTTPGALQRIGAALQLAVKGRGP